jgi:hypothetical protein
VSEPCFCAKHRSHYCRCAAPWLYSGRPLFTPTGFWSRLKVAKAWDSPKLAKRIWKRRLSPEEQGGGRQVGLW